MTTAQPQQHLHGLIDTISGKNPKVAKPLVPIRDEAERVIETDLTEEEHALIDDSVRRYHDDPASFLSLSEARRRLGYDS